MRRSIVTSVVGAVILTGSVLGSAPAHALTPPVDTLTESQFTDQLLNAVTGYADAQSGNAVLLSYKDARSSGFITINPDASYVLVDMNYKGLPETTMCLAPVNGKGDCWDLRESGKWAPTGSALSTEGVDSAKDIIVLLLGVAADDMHNSVLKAAASGSVDPTYTRSAMSGTTVLTEVAETTGLTVSAGYTFTDTDVTMTREVSGGSTLTVTTKRSEPAAVFRPTGEQVDTDALVQGALNLTAKALETEYTNNNVYPRKKVTVSGADKGVDLRVCYNRTKNPQYYTIMGTYDGGATYWVYRSDDGGLQMDGPVRTKSGQMPSCTSLKKTTSDGGKSNRMVPGPRVAIR